MSDQPTEIYAAATSFDAYELKNLLAEEGIDALVVNDNVQVLAGELPLGWATARVLVANEHAEQARKLAEEFDRQTVAAHRERRAESVEPRVTPVTLAVCPRCGRPRTAVCPICQTAGAHFLSGDMPPTDQETGEPQLLICPICDEPFEPGYLPRCEWCGHEFRREPPTAAPAEEAEAETEPPNLRVIAAAVGMVAVIAAVFAYFVWLFR
ncbi:MAG TPA: DUF2007 domain-containing protein [Pirellulales bacterium]|nr:DUF2007 domain-containing protein [Pirellulales bacterium]